MKSFRDIRVIPVVLIAIFGLAVLKVAGLVIDGGYVFDYQPQGAKKSWAQETFNFPSAGKPDPADITGTVAAKKEEAPKPAAAAPGTAEARRRRGLSRADRPVSASERAILERLQSRRQELESARPRNRHSRKPAQGRRKAHRIQGRGNEGRRSPGSSTATGQKSETDAARFKGIITMYEGMKPKDAAKVFDRLEMGVLFEIASQIAPRKMSDILGLMSPEAAERLTVEMARRAGIGQVRRGRPICPKSRARCCRKSPISAG